MQRLGPQDASFLYLETPAVHQHVGGLAILDPSTRPNKVLRFEDLVEVITSRVDLTPRFRQKIVFPPFSSARPVWADDQNFDPYFHMRRAALPSPGGRRELVDYVQRVISRPLDRTKPLWELYLIEGMEDGLVAILTKVHHAMVDGMAAIDLASAVYDFSPEPQILTPKEWTPEPEPGRFELLRDALREQVTHPVQSAAEFAQEAFRTPSRLARQVGDVLSGVRELVGGGLMAPASPFNRKVGPNRRFAMVEDPVSSFKEIKDALGGTVNDVVLTTVAGALHRLFRYRREPTRDRFLRTMVPVSVRAEGETAMGNRVSSIFVDLPIGPMSAKKRLSAIREMTKSLKESNQAVGAEFLMNIGTWAPPTIHAMAARLAGRSRFINLVVSNVPGPQIPMYIAGAKLLAQYPIMPLADTMGLSIAVTSLAGTMAFGITADWDTLPDIEYLAQAMDDSLAELRKAAGK
ncbi:MAG TPA: wax ester/triacylglycerol synthase family O-acyltransferase [Actinobacteria bacterium]|nr:wax ester/triacylglycerol synthase family O-acyltransferase [Actinomycetota bacterium]HCP61349.1 wax ester/triacylglycerol synthase family O-acyltransferase [Actinomycetota bacterium]